MGKATISYLQRKNGNSKSIFKVQKYRVEKILEGTGSQDKKQGINLYFCSTENYLWLNLKEAKIKQNKK